MLAFLFLSLMSLAFDFDIQTRPSEGPNTSSLYIWCKSVQPFPRYLSDKQKKPECRPMPNVMAAQPNIGGALCESSLIPFFVPRRKVLMTPAAAVTLPN